MDRLYTNSTITEVNAGVLGICGIYCTSEREPSSLAPSGFSSFLSSDVMGGGVTTVQLVNQ